MLFIVAVFRVRIYVASFLTVEGFGLGVRVSASFGAFGLLGCMSEARKPEIRRPARSPITKHHL